MLIWNWSKKYVCHQWKELNTVFTIRLYFRSVSKTYFILKENQTPYFRSFLHFFVLKCKRWNCSNFSKFHTVSVFPKVSDVTNHLSIFKNKKKNKLSSDVRQSETSKTSTFLLAFLACGDNNLNDERFSSEPKQERIAHVLIQNLKLDYYPNIYSVATLTYCTSKQFGSEFEWISCTNLIIWRPYALQYVSFRSKNRLFWFQFDHQPSM